MDSAADQAATESKAHDANWIVVDGQGRMFG